MKSEDYKDLDIERMMSDVAVEPIDETLKNRILDNAYDSWNSSSMDRFAWMNFAACALLSCVLIKLSNEAVCSENAYGINACEQVELTKERVYYPQTVVVKRHYGNGLSYTKCN